MRAAFYHVFRKGYRQAVLIGTDIADMVARDIHDAFQALGGNRAVLGPAWDGGFYLIGLSSMVDRVFNFSSWSTPSVFGRTIDCFESAHIEVAIVNRRKDIDKNQDLQWLRDNAIYSAALFMRKAKDYRKDSIVKVELLQQIREQWGEPFLWVDDRKQVVEAIRKEGVRVLQVAPGDF